MRQAMIPIIGIIVLSFLIGLYLYPMLPEQMVSHWNAAGVPDGYMHKFWGIFLMPLISIGLVLLFVAIPRIDPLKHNIEKFRIYFDTLIAIIIIFLFYLQMLTIFWSIGLRFSMIYMLTPAFGLLFLYIGVLTEKARRNWFIGIRTPWTLSSEKVWNKTHRLGGKLFKLAGVISFIGLAFGTLAFWFVIVPMPVFAAYMILYSYLEYRKLPTKTKQRLITAKA